MSRGPGPGVGEAGQRAPSLVTIASSHEKRFPAADTGTGLGRAGLVSWRRTAVYLPHAAPARQQTLYTRGETLYVSFKYFHLQFNSMLDI